MGNTNKFSCPHCETEIEKKNKFCPQCGIFLSENLCEMQIWQVMNLQRKGKTWDAMEQLKELVQLQPECAQVHKQLGNVYFHMGLLDWAIQSYKNAISKSTNYLDARYDLGVALYHRGKIKDAITEFQDILKLDPEYHSAHYRIGLCYHHAGQLNAAIHHLLESTVVTPDYVMAFYHLGVIYYKQDEFEKAKNAFERVLEENPHDTASAKYLEHIARSVIQT